MKMLSVFILFFVLLAGCQGPVGSSDSHYDEVSVEIERLRAEAEGSAGIGENIKIVVTMLSVGESDSFSIDSMWRYTDQNVRIVKRPEVFARSGLKIGVGGENFRARLDIVKRGLRSSEESELFIVLGDGATGYINIGKEIYVPRFYYIGRWYSSAGYEFRQAGRGLKVTARKLASGLIDMELTPVFSKFLSDGGDLELTELSTRVTARSGQTVVIGGGDSSEGSVATALLSYHEYSEKKQTLVTVTAHIRQR